MQINNLLRKNIKAFKEYKSARSEATLGEGIFLDANENPYENGYNRYPDPTQWKIKTLLSSKKNIRPENIILGNGSDEIIDLLFRAFCEPAGDKIIICTPTYGMYTVLANLNDIEIINIPLSADFQPDVQKISAYFIDPHLKMIFICSPNNPTGNLIDKSIITRLIKNFNGLVVVDEAYIDFCAEDSLLPDLKQYPNLVILQTFSKGQGLAGIRLGMGFASEEIISILSRIKYPYNISQPTQNIALEHLADPSDTSEKINELLEQRLWLSQSLDSLPIVNKVYHSDANFILAEFVDPINTYQDLRKEGILVRDRSHEVNGCLRISVGTEEENIKLIETLKTIADA